MNRVNDVRIMQFLLANPRGQGRNTAAFDEIRHDDGAHRARRSAMRSVRSSRPDSLGATSSLENTRITRSSGAHASTPYVCPRDALQFSTSGPPMPSAGDGDEGYLLVFVCAAKAGTAAGNDSPAAEVSALSEG